MKWIKPNDELPEDDKPLWLVLDKKENYVSNGFFRKDFGWKVDDSYSCYLDPLNQRPFKVKYWTYAEYPNEMA